MQPNKYPDGPKKKVKEIWINSAFEPISYSIVYLVFTFFIPLFSFTRPYCSIDLICSHVIRNDPRGEFGHAQQSNKAYRNTESYQKPFKDFGL